MRVGVQEGADYVENQFSCLGSVRGWMGKGAARNLARHGSVHVDARPVSHSPAIPDEIEGEGEGKRRRRLTQRRWCEATAWGQRDEAEEATDLEFPRTDDVDEDEHVPVVSGALGSSFWASRGENGCAPLLARGRRWGWTRSPGSRA